MVLSPAQIAERHNMPCHHCGKVQEWLNGRQMNGKHVFLCDECWQATEEDRKRRRKCSIHVKRAILERDGYKCVKCGDTRHLHVDHIVAIASGGTSDYGNLQTLCRNCNIAKRDFDEVPEHLRIGW